ncbi:MAG TPA: BatA domain-containing protein [Candidatus Sulfotelmatobacter sp.]|nr:BatA domain-containing protein [Candidatus Sulfotelmatobacter sp.]
MTGLTALNPFFLSLLPLAALPVLFHLFFRLKKSPRVFSTLMFFHRLNPMLNARRRLREWLILLLRTLLILCVLLALARPVWFGIGRQGTAAVALVIDNSGSMSGAGAEGRTKLEEAVDAARGIVAQLRDGDSAGIILLVQDPAVPLPPGLTSDKTALRNGLDHIGETEAGGSVASAMERAVALFDGSQATHFEIHVFSDLQREKWSQAPVNLRAPPAGTSIVVHRIASPNEPKSNVAIAGAQVATKFILSGRQLPLEVQLANLTAAEGRVRLNWFTDSGTRGSEQVTVPPQAEKTASLTLEPQNAGFRWVGLQIEGDDFDADNHAFIGFNCLEKRTVTFAGQPSDFGELPLAISPGGDGKLSGLIPSFQDAPDFGTGGFFVLTWDWFAAHSRARWAALKQFLEAGGSALILPAAITTANFHSVPDWLAGAPGGFQSSSNGLALAALDKASPVFNDLRDGHGDIALHNVRAFRFFPLRVSPDATPVLGLEDGRALLAEQKIGRGSLFTSGLAFDSAWSTLPLKPGFLALAQNLALAQTGEATNIVSLVAGEPLRPLLPRAGDIVVQSLGGSPLDWKGQPAQLATLPRSGVYAMRAGNQASYVAVRSSEKEGRQEFITANSLPALGRLAYTVKNFGGAASLAAEVLRLEKSLDLAPLLLLLALAALAAEGWLANPPPLKPRPLSAAKTLSPETHVAAR